MNRDHRQAGKEPAPAFPAALNRQGRNLPQLLHKAGEPFLTRALRRQVPRQSFHKIVAGQKRLNRLNDVFAKPGLGGIDVRYELGAAIDHRQEVLEIVAAVEVVFAAVQEGDVFEGDERGG